MGLVDFADRLTRLSKAARARGLQGANTAVRSAFSDAIGEHRKTGTAASSLVVRETPAGLEVECVRYLPFIQGVPHGDELAVAAAEGYNAGVRAALEGGA